LSTATARKDWELRQEKTRAAILEALFENRQCAVEYQQLWRDEPARWTLHPLAYREHSQKVGSSGQWRSGKKGQLFQ
jgi:hypothetical protein